MSKQLESIMDNYFNGNLKDAKKKAQRASLGTLVDHLVEGRQWRKGNAYEVARYLKGADNFQQAADATANEQASQ